MWKLYLGDEEFGATWHLLVPFLTHQSFRGSDSIGNFGTLVLWGIIGEWSGSRFFVLFARNEIYFCVLPFLVYHSSVINMVLCIWRRCLLALLLAPVRGYPRPGLIASLELEHPLFILLPFFVSFENGYITVGLFFYPHPPLLMIEWFWSWMPWIGIVPKCPFQFYRYVNDVFLFV